MDYTEYRSLFLRIGRGIRSFFPFAFFLLVSFLLHLFTILGAKGTYFVSSGGGAIHIALTEVVLSLLLLYSTSYIGGFGDPVLFSEVFEGEGEIPRGASAIRFFLRHRSTRIELAVMLLSSFFLPLNFGVYTAGNYFFSTIQPYLLQRLLIFAVTVPFILLAYFAGRIATLSFWRGIPSWNRGEHFSFGRRLLKYLGIVGTYIVCSLFLPSVLAVWIGFAYFILAVPALFLLLLLLWGGKFVLDFLRAVRARRRLVLRLRKICQEKGYSFSIPRHFYRKILFPDLEPNFSITVREGETYDCLVYSCIRHWSHLSFDADGYVTASPAPRRGLFVMFTPIHSVVTPYAFESSNRKIVIITPRVFRWYLQEGKSAEVFPGARAWGYKLYNTETFTGLLDRDALGEDYKR